MSLTNPPAVVAAPPTEPSRSDAPATFITRANAFIAWFATLRTWLASWITWFDTFNTEATALQADVAAKQALATAAADQTALDAIATAADALATAQDLADVTALYDQFDDRYLGAKAADPVLDNDGNALADGAFYINTVSGNLRAYTVSSGWVQGIAGLAGVTSLDGQVGDLVTKTLNGEEILGGGDIVTVKSLDGQTGDVMTGLAPNPITVGTAQSVTFASTPGSTALAVVLDADREMLLFGGNNQLHGVIHNKTAGTTGAPFLIRAAGVLFTAILAAADKVLVVSCQAGSTNLEVVVISCAANAGTVNAAVASVLGSSISGAFGPMIQVGASSIFCYGRSGSVAIARAVTVAGTVPTVGGEKGLSGTSASMLPRVFAIDATRFLALSLNGGTTYFSPYTVSAGTTLTLGTEVTQAGTSGTPVGVGFLASGRFAAFVYSGGALGCVVNVAGTVATLSTVALGGAAGSITELLPVISGNQVLAALTGPNIVNVLTDNAGVAVAGTAITETPASSFCIVGSSLLKRAPTGNAMAVKFSISGNNPARTYHPAPPMGGIASVVFPIELRPFAGGYSNSHAENALYDVDKSAVINCVAPFAARFNSDGSSRLVHNLWYTGANVTNGVCRVSPAVLWLIDATATPTLVLRRAVLA